MKRPDLVRNAAGDTTGPTARGTGRQPDALDTIGQRIKASRKRLGLNQNALGDLLGVTQPTVANWEAGAHDPRQLMLAKLADALDVSLGWLAGGEEDGAIAQRACLPYMRRPVQHVPVLTSAGAARVAGGGDPHEEATDYVPVTYEGGRLAAVFLDQAAGDRGADALYVVDFERLSPSAGELVLVGGSDGLAARTWPAGGCGEIPLGTVVASIRFH